MTKDKFDIKTISQALEKFYDGSSTLDDEQLLMEYFSSEADIPKSLHKDRDIFRAMKAEAYNSTIIPEDLEQNIIATIEHLALKEKQRAFKRSLFLRISTIAAVLAIVATIAWNMFKPHNIKNEITDPQLAYAETVKALTLISENLNKANGGIITTNNTINNINNDLNTFLK